MSFVAPDQIISLRLSVYDFYHLSMCKLVLERVRDETVAHPSPRLCSSCHFVRKFMHEIVVIGATSCISILCSPQTPTRMSNSHDDDFTTLLSSASRDKGRRKGSRATERVEGRTPAQIQEIHFSSASYSSRLIFLLRNSLAARNNKKNRCNCE